MGNIVCGYKLNMTFINGITMVKNIWMSSYICTHLVLLCDILLVAFLHLFELRFQAFQLHLHSLHILQVFLGPLVKTLDGLSHILDLKENI